MNYWEKIRKDLGKGIKEGIAVVKEGAAVVKERAEELTEEGKRRYKIFELKSKVQNWMTELGGRVYMLSSRTKNPILDRKVQQLISRIKKLDAQIKTLEKKGRKTSLKATRK